MTCYMPLQALRLPNLPTKNGKPGILFCKYNPTLYPGSGYPSGTISLPCSRCVGCRLERSRQWAMRCMFEAQLHDDNCFITLTYDSNHLPVDRSLNPKHFQDFMKRFRHLSDKPIRFYHCGEYGDLTARPHYHALIFGYNLPDRKFLKRCNSGFNIYSSEILSKCWGKGLVSVGDLSFESAAYVARYVMKKVTGDKADAHYAGRKPEYTTMSRKPGIAKHWYDKYQEIHNDVYPKDYVIVRGKKMKPPRYFDSQFELLHPDEFLLIKQRREDYALLPKNVENSTQDRLSVRLNCKLASIKNLFRNLDDNY